MGNISLKLKSIIIVFVSIFLSHNNAFALNAGMQVDYMLF